MRTASEGARDLAADLRLDGTHLIEAAAGTGKTHTIVSIYLRLLLERELPVERILVVTYTVAATAELRDRIRERLVGLEGWLRRLLADEVGPPHTTEDWDLELARTRVAAGQGPADLARVVLAVRSFDRAAVFTIHGFCQRALGEHAFESGSSFDSELLSDQSALLEEVAADFYARTFYTAPHDLAREVSAALTPARLVELARRVTARPDVVLQPERPEPPDVAALEERWHEVFREVAALWSASREEIVGQLVDASRRKVIDGRNYSPKRMAEKWTLAMDGLLGDCVPGLEGRWEYIVRFTRSELRRYHKKPDAPLPDHPFFDRCDALLALDRQLLEAFDGVRLALEHDFVAWARQELARRKRRRNALFFDDLLVGLRDALAGEGGRRSCPPSAAATRWR